MLRLVRKHLDSICLYIRNRKIFFGIQVINSQDFVFDIKYLISNFGWVKSIDFYFVNCHPFIMTCSKVIFIWMDLYYPVSILVSFYSV